MYCKVYACYNAFYNREMHVKFKILDGFFLPKIF